MVIDNNFYLNLALKEAWKYQGVTYPNPAVGSLILDANNQILSIEAHHEAGTAHAELRAVEMAMIALGNKELPNIEDATQKYNYIIKNHNQIFKNCTIFVTLEPCNHHGSTPPCSVLIKTLGFKKLVCGTNDPNKEAAGGIDYLKKNNILVEESTMKEEYLNLLAPFKYWHENGQFIFFKIATNLNGVYDSGIISSQSSFKFVHQLREKIDLLVIGGDTIRSDRPTLDCRFTNNNKAPDILIYTKSNNIDREIPLFKIKNRKVFIEENFSRLKEYKYIMIEGGQGMFKLTKDFVNWYLIFESSNLRKGKNIQSNHDLQRLYSSSENGDIISWYKKKN